MSRYRVGHGRGDGFILERQKAGIEARDEDGAYQGASPPAPVAGNTDGKAQAEDC
jgi:hypothetical protein